MIVFLKSSRYCSLYFVLCICWTRAKLTIVKPQNLHDFLTVLKNSFWSSKHHPNHYCSFMVWRKNTSTLTHWGQVTHICIGKLTIIGSDNGLLPGRNQAIIWTNAGILLIGPSGTNFSLIFIEIRRFSFQKMNFKMSSGKCRPSCLCLKGLRVSILPADCLTL